MSREHAAAAGLHEGVGWLVPRAGEARRCARHPQQEHAQRIQPSCRHQTAPLQVSSVAQ